FNSDTDADGIGDKEEYDYWLPAGDGDITLLDSDSDGLINILDFDSDNDGTSDGEEISAGTDPAAPPPELPTSTVYEDGEDGDTYGWEIFDKRPRGASISNQIDKIRGNVITFQGAGTENGYRHTGWSNSRQFIASWHQKFPDDYEISFYVKTAFGTRFITYTPESGAPDKDKRKIHHGLGLGTLGEEWHFIKRDLEADLQEAEPDNSIASVNGILIRGNGSIDDISLDSVR
ncbi:MAG: thrombospondin type 3 repeat-containing protein, partial [Thermodesulfobacteriota bacterium]